MFGPLAQHEGAPLERHRVHPRVGRPDEELLDTRHRPEGGLPEAFGLDRQLAPAEHGEALLCRDLFDQAASLVRIVGVDGQERQADRIPTRIRQREAGRLRGAHEEAVRHLHQDPGAVPGLHLSPGCAAVGQSFENGQRLVDDVVVGPPVQIRHHADTAGVVLIVRVVEANGHRRPSEGSS